MKAENDMKQIHNDPGRRIQSDGDTVVQKAEWLQAYRQRKLLQARRNYWKSRGAITGMLLLAAGIAMISALRPILKIEPNLLHWCVVFAFPALCIAFTFPRKEDWPRHF